MVQTLYVGRIDFELDSSVVMEVEKRILLQQVYLHTNDLWRNHKTDNAKLLADIKTGNHRHENARNSVCEIADFIIYSTTF